jgi:hypothetical protein
MEEFATDKRGFSRIRNMQFRSVNIRVHPWLIPSFSLRLCVSVADVVESNAAKVTS